MKLVSLLFLAVTFLSIAFSSARTMTQEQQEVLTPEQEGVDDKNLRGASPEEDRRNLGYNYHYYSKDSKSGKGKGKGSKSSSGGYYYYRGCGHHHGGCRHGHRGRGRYYGGRVGHHYRGNW